MNCLRTSLFLLLVSFPAHASFLGEENGPLVTLVAQAAVQIGKATDQLNQLRQTYDETKKYVGMAADAVAGFQAAAAWANNVIKNPLQAFDSLNPDLAYLRRDITSPSSWAQGTGELQRRISLCLGGNTKCAEFYAAVTASQARDAIRDTYGVAPPKRPDIETVDTEAAGAIAGGTKNAALAAVTQMQAKALLDKCTGGTDAAAMQACQDAANVAQILAAQHAAATTGQLAEANRLTAVRLSQEAGRDKRALQKAQLDEDQRNAFLEAGGHVLANPPSVQVKLE